MKYLILYIISFFLISCSNQKKVEQNLDSKVKKFMASSSFNNYWYDGTAEITSYKLSQFRYGEMHEGTAVHIFVTEPFLPQKQVKADYQNEKNIPVLKLNSTKKFTTGIYPYSIMTSTFSPVDINNHAIKISYSAQEWCGNTFIQLNNRDKYDIDFRSYFESNADKKIKLEKTTLENELFTQIRISPESLITGNHKIIPSFDYLALNHKEIKPYQAKLKLTKTNGSYTYEIDYPNLKRKLTINFSSEFPNTIENWEEHQFINGKKYSTSAKKMKTIKSKYWNRNRTKDLVFRDSLMLK